MMSLTLVLTFVRLLFESLRGPTMKFFAVKLKVEGRLFALSKNVLFKAPGNPGVVDAWQPVKHVKMCQFTHGRCNVDR